MLKLISPAFNNGDAIPSEYTCEGKDINPPLLFEYIPETIRSLALVMDDPDAPMGTWDHWIMWNISPEIDEIREDSVPAGAVLGRNSFQRLEYGGPCPPSGTHRYVFRLYALDIRLDLPEGASKENLEEAMENHIIEQAELIGTFIRSA